MSEFDPIIRTNYGGAKTAPHGSSTKRRTLPLHDDHTDKCLGITLEGKDCNNPTKPKCEGLYCMKHISTYREVREKADRSGVPIRAHLKQQPSTRIQATPRLRAEVSKQDDLLTDSERTPSNDPKDLLMSMQVHIAADRTKHINELKDMQTNHQRHIVEDRRVATKQINELKDALTNMQVHIAEDRRIATKQINELKDALMNMQVHIAEDRGIATEQINELKDMQHQRYMVEDPRQDIDVLQNLLMDSRTESQKRFDEDRRATERIELLEATDLDKQKRIDELERRVTVLIDERKYTQGQSRHLSERLEDTQKQQVKMYLLLMPLLLMLIWCSLGLTTPSFETVQYKFQNYSYLPTWIVRALLL